MDLSFYYEQICKYPLLTRDEEHKLIEKYHDPESTPLQKKQAKDKILSSNLRFPFKQAKVLSKGNAEQFEDLISAGNEGLVVALDKFKPNRNVKFLTYAGFWVGQRQFKEMSKMRIVAVPIWKQQLATKIMRAVDSFEQPPTCEQLKEKLPQISMKDIKELYGTRYLTFYLEDLVNEETVQTEFISDLLKEIDEEILHKKLLDHLTTAQIEIISLNFGLEDGRERTVSEISSLLGVQKEVVRSRRKEALKILREVFTEIDH